MFYTPRQIRNKIAENLADIEQHALEAAAIVAIKRKFKLESYTLEDLTILRNARSRRIQTHYLILYAVNCLGDIITYEYHGILAKRVFLIVRYVFCQLFLYSFAMLLKYKILILGKHSKKTYVPN